MHRHPNYARNLYLHLDAYLGRCSNKQRNNVPLTAHKAVGLAMAILAIWLLSEEDDDDSDDEHEHEHEEDEETSGLLAGAGVTDWADLGRRDVGQAAP